MDSRGIISLVILTVQNAALSITMRISRTSGVDNEPLYLPTVAVMTDEIIKLSVCILMLFIAFKSTEGEQVSFVSFFKKEVMSSWSEFARMAIPAVCFTVQKNLLYLGVSNVDAATKQILSQGKILTTAVFAVVILGKSLIKRQVVSLLILVVGVALVQLSSIEQSDSSNTHGNYWVGFFAILGACVLSGFSAVYFEWVLKAQGAPKPAHDVWVRNFQLATFASITAALSVAITDSTQVAAYGLYHGFSTVVWMVVVLQAFGGLLVAFVIKYADNILKNFATSISIVISVIFSIAFLGFHLTLTFVVGAICVICAVALYSSDPKFPIVHYIPSLPFYKQRDSASNVQISDDDELLEMIPEPESTKA